MNGAKLRHLKTILKHKAIVFRECKACGITWQGIIHDLSKFGHTEFVPSAEYFQGNRNAENYSYAWLHHKSHNPHHWEYWTDFDKDGSVIAYEIPYKYVVEMVCDWIGAGMVYAKGKWQQSEPLDYYNKVRAGRHFHPKTEKLLLQFLECIRDNGLSAFHAMARQAR